MRDLMFAIISAFCGALVCLFLTRQKNIKNIEEADKQKQEAEQRIEERLKNSEELVTVEEEKKSKREANIEETKARAEKLKQRMNKITKTLLILLAAVILVIQPTMVRAEDLEDISKEELWEMVLEWKELYEQVLAHYECAEESNKILLEEVKSLQEELRVERDNFNNIYTLLEEQNSKMRIDFTAGVGLKIGFIEPSKIFLYGGVVIRF